MTAAHLAAKRLPGAISRYGFGYRVGLAQHEEFLEEIATLCLVDAYAYAVDDDGHDPYDVLFDFEVQAARSGVHIPQRYYEAPLRLNRVRARGSGRLVLRRLKYRPLARLLARGRPKKEKVRQRERPGWHLPERVDHGGNH